MSLSYEQQRLQNIKDNEALLLSLGLSVPSPPPPPKPKAVKAKPTPLRREEFKDSDYAESPTPTRPLGTRRSARASTSTPINYKQGLEPKSRASLPSSSRSISLVDDDTGDERERKEGKLRYSKSLVPRLHDPKRFGSIPGVPVGKCYSTRAEASQDAIHAPMVAGISGNSQVGAWSIALSGGYADDVDIGYAFTFSGAGGRDLKGTKTAPKNLRTAPQTMHQSFDNPLNAALKRSAETQKPVRVLRGYKGSATYAPETGYRYDGLYVVERAWMAKGLTKGLLVCKYAFKRLPGQPPIPTRDNVVPLIDTTGGPEASASETSSIALVTPSSSLEGFSAADFNPQPDLVIELLADMSESNSASAPIDDPLLLDQLDETSGPDTRKRRHSQRNKSRQAESLAVPVKATPVETEIPRKRRRLVMYVEL